MLHTFESDTGCSGLRKILLQREVKGDLQNSLIEEVLLRRSTKESLGRKCTERGTSASSF